MFTSPRLAAAGTLTSREVAGNGRDRKGKNKLGTGTGREFRAKARRAYGERAAGAEAQN